MNKNELVSLVSDKLSLTRLQTEEVIDTFLDIIQETLSKKEPEKVVISGFGTFEVRVREDRDGRNPRTGAVIDIPVLKTPAFKAGKVLKDSVRLQPLSDNLLAELKVKKEKKQKKA